MSAAGRIVLFCDQWFAGLNRTCQARFVSTRTSKVAARGDAYQYGWRQDRATYDLCPEHAAGLR